MCSCNKHYYSFLDLIYALSERKIIIHVGYTHRDNIPAKKIVVHVLYSGPTIKTAEMIKINF